uniref:Uncharacterized protein n=1 Tax=Rhizophora mucronata TaxID=61149 RepID=A0A2P2IL87_RHIMU
MMLHNLLFMVLFDSFSFIWSYLFILWFGQMHPSSILVGAPKTTKLIMFWNGENIDQFHKNLLLLHLIF